MEQILAIVIGSLFIAAIAASLAFLYKDKPMQVSPCRTCTADCPSKKLSPEEQKEYYKKELEKLKAAKCESEAAGELKSETIEDERNEENV